MKRPQRETTVFSLSALDLFCSAMGVFMVLCFIALPSFTRTEEAPAPPTVAEPPPEQEKPVVLACLVLQLQWEKGGDVDMFLFEPDPANAGQSRLYFYNKRTYVGSTAQIAEDSWGPESRQNNGSPGNEIWIDPLARKGRYELYCNVFWWRDIQRGIIEPGILKSRDIPAARQPEVHLKLISARNTQHISFRLKKERTRVSADGDSSALRDERIRQTYDHIATLEVGDNGEVNITMHYEHSVHP